MPNFVSFFSTFLEIVVDFLMAEPMIWFVGLFILLIVVGVVRRLLHLST